MEESNPFSLPAKGTETPLPPPHSENDVVGVAIGPASGMSISSRGPNVTQANNEQVVPRPCLSQAGPQEITRFLESELFRLEGRCGPQASIEKLAKAMGIELKEYLFLLEEIYPVPLFRSAASSSDKNASITRRKRNVVKSKADDILLNDFLIRVLARAIRDLPDKERIVLTLRHYEKFNSREISVVLDLPQSTIHQLHSQAMIRLRAKMHRTPGC